MKRNKHKDFFLPRLKYTIVHPIMDTPITCHLKSKVLLGIMVKIRLLLLYYVFCRHLLHVVFLLTINSLPTHTHLCAQTHIYTQYFATQHKSHSTSEVRIGILARFFFNATNKEKTFSLKFVYKPLYNSVSERMTFFYWCCT